MGIIIVVVIITIAILLYIRSNVHGGSVGDGGGALEKGSDIKLTGLKSDKERIAIHKEMKYRGSGLESKGGGVYETVTDIIPSQYDTVGGGEGSEVKGDTTYSTVDDCADETCKSRHSEKRQTDQLQGGYSKIDFEESLAGYSEVAQSNNFSEADNPIYSDPDVAYKHTFTSPPDVSLQHNVPQDSEYAVIGTTGAPEIPKKSDILVDYLETKSFNVADKKPVKASVSDGGSCNGGSDGGGVGSSDMDDVYSDPDQQFSL